MAENEEVPEHILAMLGALPLGNHVERLEVRPFLPSMASVLFAAELHERLPAGGRRTRHLIIKVLRDEKHLQEMFALHAQFYNECRVFNQVIPLFLKTVAVTTNSAYIFPECVYASYNENDPMLVLENLATSGFKLGDFKAMDYDHCLLGLTTLARFHAYSYAMKKIDPTNFYEKVVEPCKEVRYVENSQSLTFLNTFSKVFGIECVKSFSNSYPEDAKKYEEQLKKFLQIVTEPVGVTYRDLVKAEEPLAVLCHGDFNRNNMLFRYGDDGKPCEMKLIDFQTVRYASPAIDISFLLFLNTTAELRAAHQDSLLRSYHQELLDSLAGYLGCAQAQLAQKFPLKVFLADYTSHALFGFLVTLVFSRTMFATPEELELMEEVVGSGSLTEENVRRLLPLGGAFVQQRLNAMLKDLLVRGYVK